MLIVRVSKAAMIAAVAFFTSRVAFGNLTDYSTGFAFVPHVFLMDTIFSDASIMYWQSPIRQSETQPIS